MYTNSLVFVEYKKTMRFVKPFTVKEVCDALTSWPPTLRVSPVHRALHVFYTKAPKPIDNFNGKEMGNVV